MSSSIDVKTRIIRAFEGPRHDKLYAIWDCINEYDPNVNLEWFPNPNGWAYSHGEAFNTIWEDERNRPSRYLLLTEADFLPNLNLPWNRWVPNLANPVDDKPVDAVGVTYFSRDPETMERLFTGRPGGWYILIDKTRAPRDLDFCGTPDPGNQLDEHLHMRLHVGEDCYPEHYGVRYHFGEHLFWSRHLHDDPNLVVAGCRLGDVQEKHDAAVSKWLTRQPKDFQDLWTTNYSTRLTT